ncbi:MAG: hypothetical protein LBL79_12240, partial [Prevotella sp.]|nr:hypothetical protein [Prevotella sp.]
MKALQDAYKEHKGGLESETAYLFIMDDSGNGKNRDTQGFMPQGKQFGYIFLKNIKDSKEDVNQIIAHDLGHGRWKLSHTFDSTYGEKIAKDDKLNLMSYGGGTHLAKWQWDVMDMPAWFTNPLEGDEKGMMGMNMFAQETEPSLQIDNPGYEISFYIGNKKYIFLYKEKVQNLTNSQFDFGNKTYVVTNFVKDGTFAGFYEKSEYQKLQDKDSKVDLSSDAAKLLRKFTAYELKGTEDLSVRSTELKDALIENNNYGKVEALIVLSQAVSDDEYHNAFGIPGQKSDCRIELGTKKTYTDECLDRYIDALSGALNKEVEYFDRNCNCIIKRDASDLLGNSDPDFQKWFTDSIGGAGAIKLLEEKIYEANLARYTDNIARGIYGADEYGIVNIPQSIKEKVRQEARESAFPAIKGYYIIDENEEAIILKNASNREGKISITAKNLDNVQGVD